MNTFCTPTEQDSLWANDRISDMLWGVEATVGFFRCECHQPFCTEEVLMSRAEYVRLRDRAELVLAPGHEGPRFTIRTSLIRGEKRPPHPGY